MRRPMLVEAATEGLGGARQTPSGAASGGQQSTLTDNPDGSWGELPETAVLGLWKDMLGIYLQYYAF